jgi:hypothetical protein
MSYELIHNTSRRAPKPTTPALAEAYGKLPKEDERMSVDPIERLEDLLDEHGVDYAWDGDTIYWSSLDGVPWTVERRHDGNLALYSPKCTPRQAIDATFGSYENELLRDKIADYDKMYTHLCEQLASVKRSLAAAHAENRKLRELLRESLMDYRQYAEKYGLAPYLDDVNEHLDARLHELGIEVE